MEHSAGRVDGQERLADFRDGLAPVAEAPDQLQADVNQRAPGAWGAWAGVLPDVAADAAHPLLELPGVDAGKSVVRARGDRARAAWFRPKVQFAQQAEPDAAVEPCTPGVDRSGARSCVELGVAEVQQPAVRADAEPQSAAAAQQKP